MWYKSLFVFFSKGILFGTTEFSFFPCFSTCSERQEKNVFCFVVLFFYKIFSVLYFSLSVLCTVYFVVLFCCDLCGVLMYLFFCSNCVEFIMKKLKKTNHNTVFSAFLFPSPKQEAVLAFLYLDHCFFFVVFFTTN